MSTSIAPLLQKATQLYQTGSLAEAESLCRQMIQLDAGAHPAWFLLGTIQFQRRELAPAIQSFERAILLQPEAALYHLTLGTVFITARQFIQAIQAFRTAIRQSPQSAAAYRGLGRALLQASELEAAGEAFQKAMQLGAPRGETLTDLATVQRRQGKLDQAAETARQAILVQPQFSWAHNILGLIELDRLNLQTAVRSFEQALALQPTFSEAWSNLAKAMHAAGHYAAAIDTLQRSLTRSPPDALRYGNLGVAYSDVGEVDQAISYYRRGVELDSRAPAMHSNLLQCMNFSSNVSRQESFDEHARWAKLHGGQSPFPKRAIVGGRPLRVGYVTPDVCGHPVAHFLKPLLEHHDPKAVTAFVYSDVRREDDTTTTFKRITPNWREITGRSDDAVARMIASDGIDILVDLTGHTQHNRLPMFARRTAPVQVSYLGYPNTTGLPAMDYRITDPWVDPPGAERWHTEKLIRLPRCFLCYQPPGDAPVPGLQVSDGSIVLGCFNRLPKITDKAIKLWSRILGAIPGARLMLKDKPLIDPQIRETVKMRLQKHGIDPGRLILETPRVSQIEHLELYSAVDLALDSMPYNGTTTTCEALWMGVPVIALGGKAHAGRVSLSILHAIGRDQWVADSEEQYVQLAVDLAADAAQRATERDHLRSEMSRSPLTDGAGLARAVEEAYRSMVR